ncbi:dihydrolipoyl dehydrogenase family protein [Nonlabens agnitus]|uniref:Dihydrolipoamide dehydrogenase n=1 Tax=Nonlabens agnitus TaxID=870484 RepID=A0A2S9WVL7_9FLAO|nr:NAD(P)/FAD-dependent oxidoreductase [Nonlabens agnitus]PRP67512.1 dihydrolipoamide dehydrogenase [Nonlabens agnitus]
MKKYDVFVLGTGTAGKLVANRCKNAGLKVGIIDNREYGGTCSQRGCDPKKLLLASSEAVDYARNMQGDGVEGEVNINWRDAYNYIRRYTQNIPDNTESSLKENGIDCYHGDGSFVDEKTFVFDDTTITANYFVIATGMQPRPLTIPGADHLLTSEDFFKMKDVPEKMVFIGGGYIGMEFSHMMARAGVKVTIIEQGDQILSPFEKFVADYLMEDSIKLGIDIKLESTLSSVEKKDGRFVVHYGNEGSIHQITTDVVYNTTGRVPSTKSLHLDKAGVVTDQGSVVVNDCLQSTTNERFYACGDVTNMNLPLTPLSNLEGAIAAKNIIEGKHPLVPVDIPSVAFTIPQVASIGLNEAQAKNQNKKFKVLKGDASGWFNTRRMNAGTYAYKVLVDDETGMVLGAHIVSHEAGETINLFSVAMNHDITFQHLQQTVFTYPSWANDLKSF